MSSSNDKRPTISHESCGFLFRSCSRWGLIGESWAFFSFIFSLIFVFVVWLFFSGGDSFNVPYFNRLDVMQARLEPPTNANANANQRQPTPTNANLPPANAISNSPPANAISNRQPTTLQALNVASEGPVSEYALAGGASH